jgi:hypothetical protein
VNGFEDQNGVPERSMPFNLKSLSHQTRIPISYNEFYYGFVTQILLEANKSINLIQFVMEFIPAD